jgi:hypothetical protein
MPILETPAADAPLSQGDILVGVRLYLTQGADAPDGGDGVYLKTDMCMVLSRPCSASHKKAVIVAAVEKYKVGVPKDLDSFDKVLDFLTKLRDGHGSPDVFYLGQLPGRADGRFAARLDSLHTVEVPQEAAVRRAFLAQRRAYSLNGEFARDLHLRVFGAFASLGFDDQSWLSDDDLNWLVQAGERDLRASQAAEGTEVAQQAVCQAAGRPFDEKKL